MKKNTKEEKLAFVKKFCEPTGSEVDVFLFKLIIRKLNDGRMYPFPWLNGSSIDYGTWIRELNYCEQHQQEFELKVGFYFDENGNATEEPTWL